MDRKRPQNSEQTLADSREYWTRELSRLEDVSAPIADLWQPPSSGPSEGRVDVSLGSKLSSQLEDSSGDEDLRLYAHLLAALKTCLHRYTGASVVVVASPAVIEEGETSKPNALPIVTAVGDGGLSFRRLLTEVRHSLAEAYARQHIYVPTILTGLGLDKSERLRLLFDVALRLESFHGKMPELDQSLIIDLRRGSNGLAGNLIFKRSRFRRDTIRRLIGHLENVLKASLVNPDWPLYRLPMMSDAERQLLLEWNQTHVNYPRKACLHGIFDLHAGHRPDVVALVCDEGRALSSVQASSPDGPAASSHISYQELKARADRIANQLQKANIKPENVVAVCLESTPGMIVSLLGTLKADAAYLPLDPAYPKRRLAFMLEDAHVRAVLTQRSLKGLLPHKRNAFFFVGEEWAGPRQRRARPSFSEIEAEYLAYVMYTSGTTGRPKGIQVTHRNVVRLVKGANYARLREVDVFLQHSPISFDASTFEIWGSLLNGARLVMMPNRSLAVDGLAGAIRQHRVTTLWLTAPLFHLMVEGQIDGLKNVRQILAGGDVLSVEHVRRVIRESVGCRLINGYGPTENTTFTTTFSVTSDGDIGDSVPIGRPIANTLAYVLDRHLIPVPIGVLGELYVGGDGLARGYLNRPRLTAERFIPNSIGTVLGRRLYRTGDMVRWLPSGDIEFIGRLDYQVKIRGFRIEPGEVDAVLAKDPGVREAVVIARQNQSKEKRLVAYVVGHKDLDIRALRASISRKLPAYMVPSNFVVLDSWPLTSSGKVDRKALPAPEESEEDHQRVFQQPHGYFEELLAGIWTQSLGLDRVSRDDNFFILGGHSLAAMSVLSRIREVFQVELQPKAFFEAPDLASLARLIESVPSGRPKQKLTPLLQSEREGSPPLSFAQERVWFLEQLMPGNIAYNFQASIHLEGNLQKVVLEHALTEVVRRHEILRTTFPAVEGKPVQLVHPPWDVGIPVVDLSGLPEKQRYGQSKQLILRLSERRFELTRLPLIRWTLLRVGQLEHILVHGEHHLIHDGWSLGRLLSELHCLYGAFCKGRASPLTRLPVQFADFAVWERSWMQGEVLQQQLDYWKEKLAGSPPVLALPTDRHRPSVFTFRGSTLMAKVPQELKEPLKRLSLRKGVSLFMTLLAAFKVLLSRYSGQRDIVVGATVANRRHIEAEELLGMIVNNVALRTSLAGNPSFPELLQRVRDTTLGAYAHQDIPFDIVVEALQTKRDLSRNPLVQVFFSFHDSLMPELVWPGLKGRVVYHGNSSSRFDLSVVVVPRGEERWSRSVQVDEEEPTLLMWEFCTDLFDEVRVRRMARHFNVVLHGLVENPGRRASELPLLSPSERHQLLVDWNDTGSERPQRACLSEIFKNGVQLHRHATAIVDGTLHTSYLELNYRARLIAKMLQARGVGPEGLVAISLERSVEMIWVMLGVWMAGGAFLPLEPDLPVLRKDFILKDSGTVLLFASKPAASTLGLDSVRSIDPRDADSRAGSEERAFSPTVIAENLAYVVYTSGSTGQPKGVEIHQSGLVNFAIWFCEFFKPRTGVRASQVASIGFDASISEVWPALLSGATLAIMPTVTRSSPIDLMYWLRRSAIDLCYLPTPLAEAVLGSDWPDELSCEALYVAGDRLHRGALRHIPQRFFNLYGPTENSVCTTWSRVSTVAEDPPIGRPLPNIRIYLLDRYLAPVPTGVAGELCVAGKGLARCYRGRPGLTAKSFVPNPFTTSPGTRLYRSGDRGRYRHDGEIEFLGRMDFQVKLRGYRIELGEIEAALTEFPDVIEAVALTVTTSSGNQQLAAFLVSEVPKEDGALTTIEDLRAFLEERLPNYMVPSLFHFLKSLPLTPNGKVDRTALKEVATLSEESHDAFVGPRTVVESRLASIWTDVLGLEQVGIHEDFFRLGGNSLLAVQVLSRILETFRVELPLRALFEASTVTELAKRVDQTPRRGATPPIRPVARSTDLPLSFAQQRLWFLDRLMLGSPLYNIPSVWRLKDSLNLRGLQYCLNEIVRRHEVLRTYYPMQEGRASQVIESPAQRSFPVIDLQLLSEKSRQGEARRLVGQEARRPFNLSQGPIFRAILLQIEVDDLVLLVTMHHIASDGWSMGVFASELEELYSALMQHRPASLPELTVQYADYAVWQRAWLQGELLEKQLSYWLKRLQGSPVLEIPTDHTRPSIQSNNGGRVLFRLDAEAYDALISTSRRTAATLFMTVLAAFQTLLHRYSGQNDIVVGTPVANRNRIEIECLIGFFVNMLVIRSDLSGNPVFTALLRQVVEHSLSAYVHQDLPFEKLVEALHPKRDLNRSPLFQVVLTLQSIQQPSQDFANLKVQSLPDTSLATRFDLEVHFREVSHGLEGTLIYQKELFDHSTMTRMVSHFRMLLLGIGNDPERRLSDFPLMSKAERQQLAEWSGHTIIPNEAAVVDALFQAQTTKSPDVVALVSEGEHLSYQELNAQANRLARFLMDLGIESESRVGILLERCLSIPVVVLAVLKAGGAYVPLDPDFPQEFLQYMLKDSSVSVLVSHKGLDLSETLSSSTSVDLDRNWQFVTRQSHSNLINTNQPDSIGYIIYTSGSTGRPKGVVVPHRGITRLVRNTNYADFSADQVFLQFAPLSFDASTFEIWGPLLNGGRLVLAPRSARSLEELTAIIERFQVSTLWLTAGLFHQFVEENLKGLNQVRQLLAGGEVLSPEHVRRALTQSDIECLINGYGPTENTTFTCCHRMTSAVDIEESVPIGRPIRCTQVFVVDPYDGTVSVGVPGELWIGGEGLARGYLGRAALTAERFRPNPFGLEPGSRIYRSGDLVRWTHKGILQFLGRFDQQVKVRGFRVEPAEIESTLRLHPAIDEAVVVAMPDSSGSKRLVGYFVPRTGSEEGGLGLRNGERTSVPVPRTDSLAENLRYNQLRSFLRERLPDYMVPSFFVSLARLPMTSSGKLDRKSLPAPSITDKSRQKPVLPRNPIESRLAKIWQEVLHIERPGVHDDFFELGGHSLLATQVVSKIRKAFGTDLPVRAFFESPTMAGMASRIEQSLPQASVPPIKPTSRQGHIPLSFAQQRLWFLDRLRPRNPFYNIAVAWRISGELNVAILQSCLNEIVRRHEILRTRFPEHLGECWQEICPPQRLPLPIIDLSGLGGQEREVETNHLINEEAHRPFDLHEGPVFRVTLVSLEQAVPDRCPSSPTAVLFLLTMHHIVSDGWSMGILRRELSVLYDTLSQGRPSPLPDLPVQYADFASWQRQWLQGEVLKAHLTYWEGCLRGAAPINLPVDRSRPRIHPFRSGSVGFHLPGAISDGLAVRSLEQGVTMFMMMLAISQVLLSRYSGQTDIVVGSPIANRNHAEIESVIGFFVNTLPLRVDLSGNPRFTEILDQVSEIALHAFAHQDLPFEKLVEHLQPRRDLGRNPIVDVLIVLQNAPIEKLSMANLKVRRWPVSLNTVRFDLELYFEEGPVGLIGTLVYNRDLFDRPTMIRFGRHFRNLSQSIVSDFSQHLSSLPLLGEEEQHQLRLEWNDTGVATRQASLHELFDGQAAKTPDAVAIIFRGSHHTYANMQFCTQQVAGHLQSLSFAEEKLVGICMEPSSEMVIGLIGVLKAGAAYIPLDPSYPLQRIDFVIEDSRLELLLTQRHLRPLFSDISVAVISVDSVRSTIPRPSAQEQILVSLDNLAYVIYTSGSTGVPKGVGVSHRGISNCLEWMQRAYRLEPSDRVLQMTRFSFDVSILEFFWPLLQGSSVIIAPLEARGDPARISRLITEEWITTLQFVPSFLRAFLDYTENSAQNSSFASVRRLFSSGEALSIELQEDCLACMNAQLHNLYGPTEASVEVTYWDCNRGKPRTSIPIGRPIDNIQIYVLDRYLRPVPIGIAGELLIGGRGLARCYLRRPSLTASCFIPNSFGQQAGKRLYRTRDLVRRLSDGNIEFLGRIDHQVKLRGFRIEPGEIEVMLEKHPAVREAIVSAVPDSSGGMRLAAYVVEKRGSLIHEEGNLHSQDIGLQPSGLRGYLRRHLPDYMVPSVFVMLEHLPLTPNGKLDRRALPKIEGLAPVLESAYMPPKTAVEKSLAGIWEELLGIERVGINDNFFELGGDSILSIQVVARVKQRIGVRLPVASIFRDQQLSALAKVIEEKGRTQYEADLEVPLIQKTQHWGTHPLSFSQERLWIIDDLDPGLPQYNLSFHWRIKENLELPALARAFSEIRQRHQILRTHFPLSERGPIAEVEPTAPVSLQEMDLSSLAAVERQETLRQEVKKRARKPFNLAQGPLFRVSVFKLAPQEYSLLVTVHHIIFDAGSLDVMEQELTYLYARFLEDQPTSLPPLPIQYGDFAHWERSWIKGKYLEKEQAYWRSHLEGALELIPLPFDHPRPKEQSYHGATHRFALPLDLAEMFDTLGASLSVTPFMRYLTAFSILLARITHQYDLLIGTPITLRHIQEESENLIGLLINTLVIRCNLSDGPSCLSLLDRVRHVMHEALDHKYIPYHKVVEAVQPQRSLSHSSLFQVMFIHQTAKKSPRLGAAVGWTRTEEDTDTAKFDLTLALTKTSESLRGTFEYNSDLFDHTTIRRLSASLCVILENIVTFPDGPISRLPLMSLSQNHQVLTEWNGSQSVSATLTPVHRLFEAQAGHRPDKILLQVGEEFFTYQHIDRASGNLANTLHSLGIGPEKKVGVASERSVSLLIGILGTLRAGGAYVPLDPCYPESRLNYMLKDSDCSALLMQGDLEDKFHQFNNARLLMEEFNKLSDSERTVVQDGTMKSPELGSLAYLIYTSGTLGIPKAVAVEHRSVAALVNWSVEQFSPYELSSVCFSTSICFDVSVFELFSTFASGGTVLVASNPLALKDFDSLPQITLLSIVPSLVLDLLDSISLPISIHTVNLAGEPLSEIVLDRLFRSTTIARVLNLYGPTEDTVYSTLQEFRSPSLGKPSIGRPLPGKFVYLLDNNLEPVPPGGTGEICLGGSGTSRGYYRRPRLTAERFIPDPYGTADSRLYRTGDLARLRPDGRLDFRGRLDNQVKVRGFRIEPEEIEDTLSRHPLVSEAAVYAEGGQLVAHFVPANATARQVLTPSFLRKFLGNNLPSYMIPTRLSSQLKLPRTEVGKLDRKKLCELKSGELEERIESEEPQTEMERTVARIWQDTMNIKKVGRHDNYFDHGGHSLGILRLENQIRKHLGITIKIREVWKHQTLRAMAALLESKAKQPQRQAERRVDPRILLETRNVYQMLKILTGLSKQLAIVDDVLAPIIRERARSIERGNRIRFPRYCQIDETVDLEFQLTAEGQPDPFLSQLSRVPVLLKHLRPAVYVRLTAPGFSMISRTQQLDVPVDRDSELIIFKLTPIELGRQILELEMFLQSHRVGYFAIETEVVENEQSI